MADYVLFAVINLKKVQTLTQFEIKIQLDIIQTSVQLNRVFISCKLKFFIRYHIHRTLNDVGPTLGRTNDE